MLLKKFPYLWALYMFLAMELFWFLLDRDDYIERLQAFPLEYFLGLLLKLLIFIFFARSSVESRKMKKNRGLGNTITHAQTNSNKAVVK